MKHLVVLKIVTAVCFSIHCGPSATIRDAKKIDAHALKIINFSIARNRNTVFSIGLDRQISLTDLTAGKNLERRGHGEKLRAISVSPDGNLYTYSDNAGRILLFSSQNKGKSQPLGEIIHGRAGINALALSREHIAFASFADRGIIKNYRLSNIRQPFRTIKGHVNAVVGLSFSADGTQLFSASNDNSARVWSVGSGAQLAMYVFPPGPIRGVRDIVPMGEFAAVVTESMKGVYLWDYRRKRLTEHLKAGDLRFFDLDYEPTYSLIVASNLKGAIAIWDLKKRKLIYRRDESESSVARLAIVDDVLCLIRNSGEGEFIVEQFDGLELTKGGR